MTKTTKIFTLLIVIVVVIILFSTKNTPSGPLKVGVINPLSGPAGNIGEVVANDIKLASSSALSLQFEDDQCDSKKAVSSYMKLKQEGTKVFYVSCSGSVLALAPLAKQDGNLILTAYAGSAEIQKTGDEVIRFIPDAVSIAGGMADYAARLDVSSRIGLLYEEQDYAKSAALILKDKLSSRIAMEEVYSSSDSSFRTQVTKLKGAKIDVLLYVPTSDKAAKLVYQEMRTLGFKPLIIGDVNTCEFPFSPKDFGLKAVCFDSGFVTETDAYRQFLSQYKNAYGKDAAAPFYDAITFDVMGLLTKFASTHSTVEIPALKSYFLNGIDGVMSRYVFTPNGEVIATPYLKMFEK